MAHASHVDPARGGKRETRGPDAVIGELADRQHGVVARWQLVELGVGRHAIDHRVERSRLYPRYRGVYAVGRRSLTRQGRWMAAVLAGGPGAVLSHLAAAAHHGIHPNGNAVIDVTVPRNRRPRPTIRFHLSSLPPDEITVTDGIPLTTAPRTLFDLAGVLRPRQLERALNEAEVLRLWDPLSLEHLLTRHPRRSGRRAVRAVLRARRAGERITRSDLELRFLELLDEAGLPQPETNVLIEGFEVDCVWRERRVVVELDGRASHLTREAFERDRERDRVLTAAGWRPLRITGRQLELGRERLEADLRQLLGAATLRP